MLSLRLPEGGDGSSSKIQVAQGGPASLDGAKEGVARLGAGARRAGRRGEGPARREGAEGGR
jgi:hypothetical protein